MAGRYFEEFEVGQRFVHDIRRTVTDMDNVLFTSLTHNPAAIHLDHEHAKATEFGKPLMNSIFTLGLVVGVSVGDTTLGTTVGNLGFEQVRFPRPVFAGDTLRAETTVAKWVAGAETRDWSCWVRVNAFDTGMLLEDLAAVVAPSLDGIVLPKANGAGDLARLGYYLDAFEAKTGVVSGHIKVLVVATETPTAMFNLGSYARAPHPRLAALTWGAEDLGSAIGATANKEPDGAWTEPYRLARSLCLFAANAAGVVPIDTLYSDFRDRDGLAQSCRIARRDGFMGRIAIHPDQVETINRCFSPSEDDLAHARRIVEAFAAQPEIGTVGIKGKMYDIPHLKQAQRILGSAT